MKSTTRKGLALGLASALAITLTSISSILPASAANKTITCYKGNEVKKVTAASPKCAAGYSTKKPAPTVLRVTRVGDTSQAFGPSRNSSGNDHFINFLLFENLVKIAPDEKTILPSLATKWTVSKDATEFTFDLRKGVKFSDGSAFDATDVANTIGLACRLTAANYIGYKPDRWTDVVGCADLKDKETGIPSGVTIVNPLQIKIKIGKGNAQYIRLLTDAVYSIIPTEAHDGQINKEYSVSDFVVADPVGTGPYTLTRFKRNQYMEFDVNPKYWGPKPNISKVFWLINVKATNLLPLLQKNELDLAIDIDVSNEDQAAKLSTHTSIWNTTTAAQFIQFRDDHPIFGNKLIRQAVLYAFDRRSVLKNVFGGKGEVRWMFPGFDQNVGNLDKYEFNPTKAKELVKASGVDMSKEFVIQYGPLADPAFPKIVPILKEQLEAVGFNVKLDPLDTAAWAAATRITDPAKATYAMTLNSGGSLGLGSARGSGFFNCVTPTFSYYAKCDIPDLYAKLFAETDPKEIDKIELALAKIINEEVPFFTTWSKQTLNVVSKKLGGTFKLYPNDRDSAMGIAGWTISK
jgi:peptide/nickel transport system substrate-binding protein